MTQPTDRLGQPLSVGDWVELVSSPSKGGTIGIRLRIGHIDGDPVACLRFDTPDADGDIGSWGRPWCYEKINPNPQTTTWDKCAFVPEGVTP